jgi:hypothetical protein
MPPRGGPPRRIWIPVLLAGALALRGAAAPLPAAPEASLPVRVYTAADGLAGNEINAILQDSRGFLWIGTDSGLSRFDGTRFVSYPNFHGLPRCGGATWAQPRGWGVVSA